MSPESEAPITAEGPDGSGTDGTPRGSAWSAVAGVVLGGAATFYVVRRLVRDWPDAREAMEHAEVWWIVAGLVLAGAAMVTMAVGWRAVLRLLGVVAPRGRVVAWYFVGELGKYVPGVIWPVVGRGELARRAGVPRSRAYTSVLLSLGMLYLAALFVAAAFLPFGLSGGGFDPWMLFLLALPVGVVALHHGFLGRVARTVERLTGVHVDVEIPMWGDSLRLVARYVPAWLFVGTATWAVARALDPGAPFARVVFATVLSWAAGFLAVPVPAGAGVREAVLTATSGLDGGVAAATAIVARVLFVLVDVVAGLVAAPFAGRPREGASVGPVPRSTSGHGDHR
ncbi:MAG: flippase-like domain-containing protein [Actinobacteria bacterium]|nr:flippase-like domain-containing protein [Actinomycetota bacterium]